MKQLLIVLFLFNVSAWAQEPFELTALLVKDFYDGKSNLINESVDYSPRQIRINSIVEFLDDIALIPAIVNGINERQAVKVLVSKKNKGQIIVIYPNMKVEGKFVENVMTKNGLLRRQVCPPPDECIDIGILGEEEIFKGFNKDFNKKRANKRKNTNILERADTKRVKIEQVDECPPPSADDGIERFFYLPFLENLDNSCLLPSWACECGFCTKWKK